MTQERIDTLTHSKLKIIQNPRRFCFGIDAILLADFAKVKRGETVCDLGTGTGIIPLLLCAKTPSLKAATKTPKNLGTPATRTQKNSPTPKMPATQSPQFYGIEILQDSADMARRSVELNLLQDKIQIIAGDIKDATKILGKAAFDVVTCNPPYMVCQQGAENATDEKSIARHEVLCNLEDVVRAAAALLKSNGRFFMIHRPFRLAKIIAVLKKYKLEPKRLCFVYPTFDKAPTMVLIESEKGALENLIIEPPLVVYKSKGEYTDQMKEIYARV